MTKDRRPLVIRLRSAVVYLNDWNVWNKRERRERTAVASRLVCKFFYGEHAPVLIQVFKDREYNSL